MFCTNCGMQLDDNVTVCPNCGTQLGEVPLAQPQQQAAQAQPQQQAGSGQPMPVPTPMPNNNMQQQNFGGQQQNFGGPQQNYGAQQPYQGPINIDPVKNVRFTPQEQQVLGNGCKTVSIFYLVFAILNSVGTLFFLLMTIVSIVEIDYAGVDTLVYSLAVFLDLAAVAVVFYIKFAEYKKLQKSVSGDTSMIINKFRNYSIAPGIILSVFFFMLGLIPVIITENSINKPLKQMLSSL